MGRHLGTTAKCQRSRNAMTRDKKVNALNAITSKPVEDATNTQF